MSIICVNTKKITQKKSINASIKAYASVVSSSKAKLEVSGNIVAKNRILTGVNASFIAESDFKSKNLLIANAQASIKNEISITAPLQADAVLHGSVRGIGSLSTKNIEKLGGNFDVKQYNQFTCLEKLYPTEDVETSIFLTENLSANNIYNSIDGGVIETQSISTYIQPSSIYTDESFTYKCKVNNPVFRPINSYLKIRASAPLINFASKVPPKYTISNIRLEDPSGNLLIKYKDFEVRGESNFDNGIIYSTYITEQETNHISFHTWEDDYPILTSGNQGSGYVLSLDFTSQCLDDPFSKGFDFGYQEYLCELNTLDNNTNNYLALDGSPLSTQFQGYGINSSHHIRIAAIELCNSGELVTFIDNYLPIYSEVTPTGLRINKSILPVQVLDNTFDTTIYPSVTSTWQSSPDIDNNVTDNTSVYGSQVLTSYLRNPSLADYITLNSSSISDSGKLTLKFSHDKVSNTTQSVGGAFSFGLFTPNREFFTSYWGVSKDEVSFFTVDSVELKVIAKKAPGSRDYVLDVVGYSDDKLLNVTSAVGGFLQNVEGSGSLPTASGFDPSNELGISSETISDKSQYFENRDLLINTGGDHYKLSTSPVINSTSFQEYTIPLAIYPDLVELGQSTDYSNSSYFESLYLDIYPIPSGASIASIKLVVSYKPSNAMMLHTLGQGIKELTHRDVKLFPSQRKANDRILNSGPEYSPLSFIENIPHGFTTPSSIKTNYSRRWRGIHGSVVEGPFDPNAFDFSYYNPIIEYPFLSGYFNFSNTSGNVVFGDNVSHISGIFNSSLANSLHQNIGWRFSTDYLFDNQTSGYKTTDWTYEGHELYGQIADAFDRTVRVSGQSGYFNFGNVNFSNGFAIYTRFTPDYTISGVDYNQFNSGVLFSKWNSGSNLEFALGYESGYLCGFARDNSGNVIKVIDSTDYTTYQYPLSVLLTYNDDQSNTLKLYTDNEIASGNFNILRDTSSSFVMNSGISNLTLGYSLGSGVGINAFVHEFGISTPNIVTSGSLKLNKEIDAENFFSGNRIKFWSYDDDYQNDRYQLWDYIDEDTDAWHLGAFKICSFNHEYDRFTKRIGSDYILHHLVHNGSTYSTDLLLPSSIPSDVCYHTQIENDSLRFNIGALPESFNDALYSANPRISKNLPKGYNFEEQAFVVDTILEYESDTLISWSDGNTGPRLIVSLYTTNKEPLDYPTVNYGLINRYIHYLETSGCWNKISSIFTFDNFTDETTEPWSNFNNEKRLTEFNHKYFSKDIDDMFLQYDIVYPSGSSFESKVKIHSANVKLTDALIESRNKNNQLNLVSSGEAIRFESLNLYTSGIGVLASGLNLIAEGGLAPSHSGTLNIYCSGAVVESKQLNLYTINYNTLTSSIDNFGSLFGSNGNQLLGPNLFIQGMTDKFDAKVLPLFTQNLVSDFTSSGSLFLTAFSRLPKYSLNDNIPLSIVGSNKLVNFVPEGLMNLYLAVDTPTASVNGAMNLYVNSFDPKLLSDSVSLFTINLPVPSKLSQALSWNNKNVGKDIDTDDNIYSALNANDEIRGVELICYGDCNTTGCFNEKIVTHDTEWQPLECVDGGILRASKVYTNLEASGFNTDVGYSGHFYGIKKLTGLIPSAPYNITLAGKTGEETSLGLPRELEEWEYGFNNYVGYSGVKIVADSGNRNENDNFGASVAVKNNIMAIGAPNHDLYDSEGYLLEDAGTVFVYHRNLPPSGFDWSSSGDKASWTFATKLTLPSGYIRDYIIRQADKPFFNEDGDRLPFAGTERIWKVGQEGRNLGYTLDICSTNNLEPSLFEENKNLIVVGGPGAKWTREFAELEPSGVNIGLFIFTDEFIPEITVGTYPRETKLTYLDVLDAIKDKDILFRYFSTPPVSFNVKLIICETLGNSNRISVDFPEPKPSFIVKQVINRHSSDQPGTLEFNNIDAEIFTDIKSAFELAFPYDESKLNNNIPSLIGFYIDDSRSAGGEDSIQPALNNFIDYYQQYSFASGLQNFFGVPSSGVVTKYIDIDENWIVQSNTILDQTLDTGRLFITEQFKFFTSGIGDFNPEISDFNNPPPSGGAVYIFERESGVWNLIQTIESPTQSNIIYPDRFGHSVDISDNGEIIIVGSPYINDAITVYQYNTEEKSRLYDNVEGWITYKKNLDTSFTYYYNMYERYVQLKNVYGRQEASKMLYVELTPTAKYDLRTNYGYWGNSPINEYSKIFTYSYSEINYGAWQFLVEEFAPTSRLGYSVAVNEDGSIIAAGAPTDSFDEFDSSSSYYAPTRPENTTWPSYVNAGAVRVFESRKYYPHNRAIEYSKFGNLEYDNRQENEDQLFNHMEDIYNEIGIPFTKTQFADVDIPQEAGLALIITPYIDALSDEILTNIKNWLALGDRNLVLVGNDPIWEEDGIYASSNELINKILNSLDSRLRIVPARSQTEALVPASGANNKVNIMGSFIPSKSRNTGMSTLPMIGHGVGDIKPYWPNANRTYDCSERKDPLSLSSIFDRDLSYGAANDKCEIPIYHLGDLRSQWQEWCVDVRGEPITYSVNWPLFFGTINQGEYGCYPPDNTILPTYGYDATPVLVAAEYPEPYEITYPYIPQASSLQPVSTEEIITGFGARFDSQHVENVEFIWYSGGGNYTYLNRNMNNTNSTSAFFDPPLYNEKDAILQAKASNKINIVRQDKVVSDPAYFAAEQQYSTTTSKIVLLAGMFLESADILYSGTGDSNLNFYFNLVAKTRRGGAYIAQLGDWTGRQSFKDAYSESILQKVFLNTFNIVKLNVSTDELTELGHPSGFEYDVCWIANPNGLPSNIQIQKIKNWLSKGNKKLIITYDYNEDSYVNINIAKTLCEIFNVNMRPLYLTEKAKYAVSDEDLANGDKAPTILVINPNNFVSTGFDPRKDSIEYLPVNTFIPISLNNSTPIAYTDNSIVDNNFISVGVWQLKTGVTEIQFPTIPGSGYKVFIDLASEHFSENEPLQIHFAGCSQSPSLDVASAGKNINITDIDNNTDQDIILLEREASFTVNNLIANNFNGNITSTGVALQAASDLITLYIDANNPRLNNATTEYTPRTTRLVSISGCLLPINPVANVKLVDVYDWVVKPEIPERTVTIVPDFRPISTDNSKYCPSESCIETFGNKLIADGPIVAAQELEIISNFEYGVARSRITVISDSSFVQGKYMVDENGTIQQANISFIQSLYPFTNFPSQNNGRTFEIQNKIQSPERGSPQRFFNAIGNDGINVRFQVSGVANSGRLMSDFIESFNYDNFKGALYPTQGEPSSYLTERALAFDGDEKALLSGIKENFRSQLNSWGGYSKFNMQYNGLYYQDANVFGGVPLIMQHTDHDYLDFDYFKLGYPGDLFGYSIALYKNKLIVGSPFAAYSEENITDWSDVQDNTSRYETPSGIKIGYNGGAGSVYIYERTGSGLTPFGRNIPWECTSKLRPNSINLGQDIIDVDLLSSGEYLGPHNYTPTDILEYAKVSDQFGHSVAFDGDIIAVGAPGHDFENYVKYSQSPFMKKAFGKSFDIEKPTIYDLGNSGTRNDLYSSGIAVLNNGAIFTFENKIIDWNTRQQNWKLVQKVLPQGYNSRLQKTYTGSEETPVSGSENDRFGACIALDRNFRTDADYTLIAGTKSHLFALSGDATLGAGASYVYNGMLREQNYSYSHPESFINASVFGTLTSGEKVSLSFKNEDKYNTLYFATGIVYSNNEGEIFLEASGQDFNVNGYINHRPYIVSINGGYVFGTDVDNSMRLFANGSPTNILSNMNLFSNAASSHNVYNTLGLYQSAILGFASGIPNGLNLYLDSPAPVLIENSGLFLSTSGIGINTDTLNMRIRGK